MVNGNARDTGGAFPEEPPTGDDPPAPDKRIGTVVDKYAVVSVLGRGGMGTVYEVRHGTLARRFAMKFLLPELAANRDVLRRFANEAKAAGGLEHPNLAAVTDFGRAADGSPYLVMEFLEGEDCAKLLRRLGPLPLPRAANIVVQACRGLAVAHRAAIIHRDLKPENLFVTDAGDGSDLVKVLDFGIAKLRPSEASIVTGTGATFGTAYYMSPEQARGAGEVDQRADVWSLGVLLYELLAGRRPFAGDQFLNVIHQILSVEPPPLATLRPGLPPKLLAAVEQAMKKDLAQRFPSVSALGEALAPFAGRETNWAPAPVRSREAMLATLPTPATGIVLPSGRGSDLTTDVPAADSSASPALTRVPGRVARLMLGGVMLVVVAGGLAWGLRHGSKNISPAVAAHPEPAKTIEPPSSFPIAPPLHPHPDPSTAGGSTPPKDSVRTVSDHVPNRRGGHSPAKPRTLQASPPSTPPPAKPANSREARGSAEPIDIQRENPYDP